MADSIGELFVDLGFNVDDQKLKDFNSGLKTAASSMLELAGITATVGGFTTMLNGAANTATQLRNLSTELGVNQRAAQGWAAALHEANPLVSFDQGLQSVRKVSEYIRDMQSGKNNGTAIGMFGGSAEDNTPEKVQARIRQNLDAVINQYGVARTSQWLDEIYGSVGAINVFRMSVEEYQRAADKGIVGQENLDNLVRYNQSIADLGNSFDQLKARWLSLPAEKISGFLNGAMNGTNTYNDSWWGKTVSAVDKGLTNTGKGLWSLLLTAASPRTNPEIIEDIVWGDHSNDNKPAPASAGNKDAALSYFQSQGWSAAQAQGILADIMSEGGLNPGQYGKGAGERQGEVGEAYGIGQWHPDRQQDFERVFGHSIKGSSLDEQLEFMNYELTKGNEQAAGRELKKATNADDAFTVMKSNYERAGGTSPVTINNNFNITGTDQASMAQQIAQKQQEQINSARAQNSYSVGTR